MSDIITIDSETLRKLQLKELDSLKFFDKFCKENDLTYYLLGGCVIGSLRHKGFIPWDDDIDLIMPRKDYTKMLELWNGELKDDRYILLKTDGEKIFTGNTFATLIDTSSTLIKENQQNIDVPHGIVTDIFPMDGCPDSKIKRYMQYYHAMMYSLFITEYVPTKHGGVVSLASKILLGIFKGKKIRTKIWKRAEKKASKYDFDTHDFSTELYAGPGYMKNKYPHKAFAGAAYSEFEGMMVPIPQGYDTYLSMAFGDYMSLPKEEDRVPHHDLVKLDLDTPCL